MHRERDYLAFEVRYHALDSVFREVCRKRRREMIASRIEMLTSG
jgi:hypothetical protein